MTAYNYSLVNSPMSSVFVSLLYSGYRLPRPCRLKVMEEVSGGDGVISFARFRPLGKVLVEDGARPLVISHMATLGKP